MKPILLLSAGLLFVAFSTTSCKKDDMPMPQANSISIENVLDGKPLVESGTFMGTGTPPVILPGQTISFSFYAGKNQTLTFATMYGWSNDLFFAPANPGIALYDADGNPITGDVSTQVKLWDNGTRVNQVPGSNVTHPGMAEASAKNIKEVVGTDDFGNSYLPVSQLMHVTLFYDGNSKFTCHICNVSNGTPNETPFSPGTWAISYVAGGNPLLSNPIYAANQPPANGLTDIAETGNVTAMSNYLSANTGTFTPLSPVLVVVYNGTENPFYKTGEADRGKGLAMIAQKGNADMLAEFLRMQSGIKSVYVLKEPTTTVLLPRINGVNGGKVSQQLSVLPGDKVAIATMYGFSNDWFFATKNNDIDATQKGDFSSSVGLFDNGTVINQYPGAGVTQPGITDTPLSESKAIELLPNPNAYTTLPSIQNMIKVTLE